MKTENIKLIHKKGNHLEKDNYQPVSVLPNLSKVLERCIYNQRAQLFDKTPLSHQCGFRQGHSAQYCLIVLLEKWRERVAQASPSSKHCTSKEGAY